MAVHTIYKFYAELDDYWPKIWRRFEVNGNKTIAELGYSLMVMFEMTASHLFCLTHDSRVEILADLRNRYSEEAINNVLGKDDMPGYLKVWRYELPIGDIYPNENEIWNDASKYRIKDILNKSGSRLSFEYDYGDGWLVNLTLESCVKEEIHASMLPRVLEGEGYGIIEDCGGTGGLEDLAKAFKKKKGRQYDEFREWLGIEELALTAFDIDDINFRLKKLPRIYKEIYEYGYEPTQRSIDLIERKYRR